MEHFGFRVAARRKADNAPISVDCGPEWTSKKKRNDGRLRDGGAMRSRADERVLLLAEQFRGVVGGGDLRLRGRGQGGDGVALVDFVVVAVGRDVGGMVVDERARRGLAADLGRRAVRVTSTTSPT